MPLGPQPRRARGTIEHPNSALQLRLVLAIIGFLAGTVGGIVLWHVATPIAIALFVLAGTALVDIGVIMTRLSRR